jgi:Tfp pilus assembly protein PilV
VTRRSAAGGFAYAEVMIAALILALCAVPAANAIRNGLDAGQAGPAKAAELLCVRNLMETVLAEPYATLNMAAGSGKYNLDADAVCTARKVDITLQRFDGATLVNLPAAATDEQKSTALLKVRVYQEPAGYTFTTVVAR